MAEINLNEINPNKYYTLVEILKSKLIPGVEKYSTLYCLITYSIFVNGKRKRIFVKETTNKRIKAEDTSKYFHKTNVGIVIRGSELLKFLRLNNF